MGAYLLVAVVSILGLPGLSAFGADEAILKPRVPVDQLQQVRTWKNPLPATDETIDKGKKLFEGKPSVPPAMEETARDWEQILNRERSKAPCLVISPTRTGKPLAPTVSFSGS